MCNKMTVGDNAIVILKFAKGVELKCSRTHMHGHAHTHNVDCLVPFTLTQTGIWGNLPAVHMRSVTVTYQRHL